MNHSHFPSIIKLNVGGKMFTTSLQTLTQVPGTMLCAMFSGNFNVTTLEDGSYFIDRDGTCFHYILNYLRTGKLLLPDDEMIRNEVLQEADFYQIQGIKDKLSMPSSTIKLNVGGEIFTTSRQTLQRLGNFGGQLLLEDGMAFIDRDGTSFRYILNFLRNGKLLLPDDELIRKKVLEEAKFYQIEGIVNKLKPKPYSQSVILLPQQRQWLAEVAVGKPYDDNKLLYRASRDGWTTTDFHNRCDLRGPTLVVIKADEYVFGGYTEQPWDRSGTYKVDKEAFLFSLVNDAETDPIKLVVLQGGTQAIHCDASRGPVFGNSDLDTGHEFDLKRGGYSVLGSSYRCPEGQRGERFFVGGPGFLLNEVEVFEHMFTV